VGDAKNGRKQSRTNLHILSMNRLKQVEEQIYLFGIFCGYFFYFFTFYRDVHLPVVGFEGFLS
jgi:hypothetical protein